MPTLATLKRDLKLAKIAFEDEAGRVADFHALRSTFATMLAQSGTPPQTAMKAMRHAKVGTTMNHYTHLRLADTAPYVARLPDFGAPREVACEAATGTGEKRLQYKQQRERENTHFGATRREATAAQAPTSRSP